MADNPLAQALAKTVVDTMMSKDAFSKWLGIEVLEVSPGQAVVRMKVRSEMLNGFAVCHGGIPFSVADSAFAFAANTGGRESLSIENTMSYAKKIVEGDVLTARAREASPGDKIAVYDVSIENQTGQIVALFRGTVYRTSREYLKDG